MLKKYKILVLTIVLTMVGIVIVVGTWLYGGYSNKREQLVGDVDRSLFNAIQRYYNMHQDSIKKVQEGNWQHGDNFFMREVVRLYPQVNVDRLQAAWDSVWEVRAKVWEGKRGRSRNRSKEQSPTVPAFLLQNINFDERAIAELSLLLDSALSEKKVYSDVIVELKKITASDDQTRYRRYITVRDGDIVTKPILVHPEKDLYIVARIDQPLPELLSRLAPQISLSLLLLLALIGTFIYLLWTISKQNKMALLRKSFVNNMTHELKTPVATVIAAVDAVQRYQKKDDRGRVEKYLSISQRELEHLSGLIERVLQLDIDEVRGLSLDKSHFDIVALINDCTETMQLGVKKEVQFHVKSSQSVISIFGDQAHLKNVFNNLLDNAMKYSSDSVSIHIDVRDKTDAVEILVADNGVGIDSGYHKDIFDMFFRVPSGNLHPVKGFGVGLAYVKQVVSQHRGDISVDSKPGEGTTFSIHIPK